VTISFEKEDFSFGSPIPKFRQEIQIRYAKLSELHTQGPSRICVEVGLTHKRQINFLLARLKDYKDFCAICQSDRVESLESLYTNIKRTVARLSDPGLGRETS
jgi:hypothetical protein